jgi:hypothetical protein
MPLVTANKLPVVTAAFMFRPAEVTYCTVLAVLVRDLQTQPLNLSLSFFIPRPHRRYCNRSVTTSSYTNGVNNRASLSILRLQPEELTDWLSLLVSSVRLLG